MQGPNERDQRTLLDTLRTLEVALHQPDIRADAVRLGRLLHASFREFGRSGREYSRDEILAEFASNPPAYEIVAQDYRVESLAPALALLTYRSAHVGAGGALEHRTVRMSLWQLTEAGS